MKISIKLSIFTSLILFFSCAVKSIKGNQQVIKKERVVVDDFSKIKVAGDLDVYIYEGEDAKIIVEADQNLHQIIKTNIKKGVLNIFSEKKIQKHKANKVYITIPNLSYITSSKGSNVQVENFFNSKKFTAISDVNSKLIVRVNSVKFTAISSDNANLVCIGNVDKAKFTSTKKSIINAFDLKSKKVDAIASGRSVINIYTTKSITATANDGGYIIYKGSPKKTSLKSSAGGKITRE